MTSPSQPRLRPIVGWLNGRRSATLGDFAADLRYAARTLRLSPGFTLAAVVTLAIGIGANTAIFSAVDGVLLKPLPFSQPDRIVSLFQNDRKKGVDHDAVAPGNFVDWRAGTTVFAGMAGAEPFALNYSGPEGEEQIYNWKVTEDFFSVLNARPALGRLFRPSDFVPNSEKVLILTFASWQRRFGADPAIIGKQLRIGGAPETIIGVLPRSFAYLETSKMEIYAPSILDSALATFRNTAWWSVVGRLKPGATTEQASADLNRVAARLSTEYPATNTGVGVTVVPLRDTIVGDTARAMLLLLGTVGFVLLIACANVGNLIMARTTRRGREFAIRAALGAGRARVVRQVLTESFLLALAGGLVGTLLAFWGVATIRALSPISVPRVSEMQVDGRALAFTLVTVLLTTFVFGLLPALRAAQPNAAGELTTGARAAGSGRQHRLRGWFITIEIALAMILLVGTGLLVRSFVSVERADRGYNSDHVLSATLFIYKWNKTPREQIDFVARLVERAAALQGAVAAGATSSLPLDIAIGADHGPFTIDGRPVAVGGEPSAHMTTLTPGTFDVLRLALRRGRLFTPRDDSGSVPVAIISEAMARRYWRGEDPIGKHIKFAFYGPPADREIVGVVADVRQVALDAPVEPTLYVPLPQAPTGAISLVLRTTIEPRLLARSPNSWLPSSIPRCHSPDCRHSMNSSRRRSSHDDSRSYCSLVSRLRRWYLP
jgi:putative ABC transport system permease protein